MDNPVLRMNEYVEILSLMSERWKEIIEQLQVDGSSAQDKARLQH
jgi:hypothetical protein